MSHCEKSYHMVCSLKQLTIYPFLFKYNEGEVHKMCQTTTKHEY